MNIQEKAKELYQKAGKHAHANVFSFRYESFHNNSKAIAMITVDEIIQMLEESNSEKNIISNWKEVKLEIEELSKKLLAADIERYTTKK